MPACYHDSEVKGEKPRDRIGYLHLLLFRQALLKLADQGLDLGFMAQRPLPAIGLDPEMVEETLHLLEELSRLLLGQQVDLQIGIR
jgi:hypothetical protein